MTTLALGAATLPITDAEILNGVAVPAATGTAISTNTTVTFPWAQNVILAALAPSGNTCTLTFVNPVNAALNFTTGALTAATTYYFGPFPSGLQNQSGLVTFTITGTLTGATFKVFLLPSPTGASHSPFDPQISGVTDY